MCWGNLSGPHHDVALADIAEIILAAVPKFISLEACNPGHAHEHEVWKQVKIPSEKARCNVFIESSESSGPGADAWGPGYHDGTHREPKAYRSAS